MSLFDGVAEDQCLIDAWRTHIAGGHYPEWSDPIA
jgi:hypothetical protein